MAVAFKVPGLLSFRDANASVNALVHIAPPERVDGRLDLRVAVKDNICTSGMPTTCSSAMLLGFTSPFDATVVELLQAEGAQLIGKTNCDEFGMGSLNTYSFHNPVINPFQAAGSTVQWTDRERRSAGGRYDAYSAAEMRLKESALATDTGGSIRLPASYCGVVGLKPSYGLVSRWGVVSYADSLDCVGVMARSVDTVKKLFDVISSYDPKDPTAAHPRARKKAVKASHASWLRAPGESLKGLRIGIPQEYFPSELDASTLKPLRRVLEYLKSRDATLIPVSLPTTPYALSAYYVISSAEASSNMARYDGVQYGYFSPTPPDLDKTKAANVYAHSRSSGFGNEVQKRILLGTYALSADAFDNYFLQAQRVRNLVRADFDRVFAVPNVLSPTRRKNKAAEEGIHVLLHPSAIRTAPPLESRDDAQESDESVLDAYVQDVLNVPASLAGLPAMSVPAGLGEDGWPVGVSIVGQWGSDELVMEVGRECERADLAVD
ncbi:hypothetical protein EVJ58_g2602 [Rhodofomes roseus]|uniref:Glutamyl-tRNA(Gln) amidotransferase subunit A, mitochondrial n=1 Tax=Rhodofomes roseus TaxID=34475 RepID=A0A4Y9YQR5_9APHY|nr:hypothetical protein EVJ58_g2602 [Rhodofomes roseus]